MKYMILGFQRSGTTFIYSTLHSKLAEKNFTWEDGNNLFNDAIKNGNIDFSHVQNTNELLTRTSNCVIKQHYDSLQLIHQKSPTVYDELISNIDHIYHIIRKNTFELVLSHIMWYRSGQHGDGIKYQLETYPTITISEDEFIHERDMIISERDNQLNYLIEKCGVVFDDIIYYEDFLFDHKITNVNSNKAPSKTKYITNYDELRDKFDV